MKIAIMSTMPPETYSGGRYCAWVMGECLAEKGNDVYFITNNRPIFYDDFKEYPNHYKIHLCLTNDFDVNINEEKLDYVVLIPNQDKDDYFYVMCRNFAIKMGAKLVLENFESANWFNKYSPVPRDESMWKFWREACKDGCLVLSFAKEAMKYAQEFYVDNPQYTRFDYWAPAINSRVADRIDVEKEKRIISFVRFQDSHKGGGDIFDLFGDYLQGYTMVFVVGNGKIDRFYENKLEFLADKYGFFYEIKVKLSDEEKFREIKRAQVMLFPSYFEGYGYPPVEAQYCNTICIAYDLPILREISGDGLIYCDRGNVGALRDALKKTIEQYKYRDLRSNIMEYGDFSIRAERINQVLEKYLEDDYRDPGAHCLKVVKPERLKTLNIKPAKKKTSKKSQNAKAQKNKKLREQNAGDREKRITLKDTMREVKYIIGRCINKCYLVYNRVRFDIKKILFLRALQIHLGTMEYEEDSGRLYLKGWYWVWRGVDKINVLNGSGDILGIVRFGLKRPDIYNMYPKYETMNLGFEFDEIVQKEDLDGVLRIQIKCGDGKMTWADFPMNKEG